MFDERSGKAIYQNEKIASVIALVYLSNLFPYSSDCF